MTSDRGEGCLASSSHCLIGVGIERKRALKVEASVSSMCLPMQEMQV